MMKTRIKRRKKVVVSHEWRSIVIKRDGVNCYLCRKTLQLFYIEMDHAVPLSRGGRHHMDNLRVICSRCNTRKSNKFLDEIDWNTFFS